MVVIIAMFRYVENDDMVIENHVIIFKIGICHCVSDVSKKHVAGVKNLKTYIHFRMNS